MAIRFVVSIEDKAYFHWQLSIFLESLVNQLPEGSGIDVVVCNDYAPLSPDLATVFTTYGDVVRYLPGTNYGRRRIEVQSEDDAVSYRVGASASHAYLDVQWRTSPRSYIALNRVEALNVVGDSLASDMIVLMDPDIFLYGQLNPSLLPDRNSLQENTSIGDTPFFRRGEDGRGVLLPELLRALQCEHPYKPGGVTVFLDAETVRNKKFIGDCFRFAQLLYLAGQIVFGEREGPERAWVSEMACFSLALTVNGIPYQVLEYREFSTWIFDESIPSGTFYHYYASDSGGRGFGAFPGSPWDKKQHYSENLLRTADLVALQQNAVTDHERVFFGLARSAKTRLGW